MVFRTFPGEATVFVSLFSFIFFLNFSIFYSILLVVHLFRTRSTWLFACFSRLRTYEERGRIDDAATHGVFAHSQPLVLLRSPSEAMVFRCFMMFLRFWWMSLRKT